MSKEDLGKFGFNARGWKIFPKSRAYDENFDKIFKKKLCMYCFKEVKPDSEPPGEEYICYPCYDKFFEQAAGGEDA